MNQNNSQVIAVGDMRKALLALRQRTGDNTFSHTVKAGRFQLCRVVYYRRSSVITPLSPWQDAAGHLKTLNTYAP